MKNFLLPSIENKLLVMGIVNVTPDSFSDGGRYNSADLAIQHGLKLISEGAHILDIGGESSRPNAQIISVKEEIRRVIPVIEGLNGKAEFISIDTRNAKTMQEAIKAGANIINDISALEHDPESVHVISENGLPVCLMHIQGTPQTMQKNPKYGNVVDDIFDYFTRRIEYCIKNNVDEKKIIIDVGIGFGKTLEHNLLLLKNIKKFKEFGLPLLLGTSRKSFIAALSHQEPADQRIGGSIASVLWGIEQGVDILRVHDVVQTVQALTVYNAIKNA